MYIKPDLTDGDCGHEIKRRLLLGRKVMTNLDSMTWVWASSESWWWTGKPGVLQSMGLQKVRHGWATELNCVVLCRYHILFSFFFKWKFCGNPESDEFLGAIFFLRAFARLVSLCHFGNYYSITPKDSCDMLYWDICFTVVVSNQTLVSLGFAFTLTG